MDSSRDKVVKVEDVNSAGLVRFDEENILGYDQLGFFEKSASKSSKYSNGMLKPKFHYFKIICKIFLAKKSILEFRA